MRFCQNPHSTFAKTASINPKVGIPVCNPHSIYGLRLCLHHNLVHSHPSLGGRPGDMAQVGGQTLQNPKVKQSKSVATSGRNTVIDGGSGAKQ